ncbi:Purine nucleoside phosphorylase [Meloidogyne graminicola]|uniref:purine-nucleoside phosphorylase n=1 Tax=Meloidogyne graminicola TaxID=189291 RepID=A0A8S9ZZ86_9BILA|nr:Purine nucleoside phosphorylase [Meloidogyne graminicola]
MSIYFLFLIIKFIFILLFSFLSSEELLQSKLGIIQNDYFNEGQQQLFRQQPLNYGNNFGFNGDTVNFDFLCKCQAKSSLTRTSTPSNGDSNTSTQQQVQQLQEQVKKLQEQINKSQQGKSSFEQFGYLIIIYGRGGEILSNNNNNNFIPHQIISPPNRIINPLSITGNGQFIPMGGSFSPRKYNDLVWLSKEIILMSGIKNISPQIGIICGSGLNDIANKLEQPIILPFNKLPGFPLPSVIGHKGNVIFGWLGGKCCVCLQGRFHPYEHNMDMALCTMPVRLMALMGIKTLIASNAAGGINPNLNIGDLMLIKDHIFMPGLVGFSPLVGLKDPRFGNRFISMQNAYDQKLRKKALILAEKLNISVKEGVYLMNAGPHYETVSECSLAAKLGGDALGIIY